MRFRGSRVAVLNADAGGGAAARGGGSASERSWSRAARAGAAEPTPRTAFASWYREHVRGVYRYVYARVGNVQDAEDLTAQVFVDAFAGRARLVDPGGATAWLFTIARRRVADHFRRHRATEGIERLDAVADRGADPLEPVLSGEVLRSLAGVVAGLSDDERELLRLRFAADLTYGQMAEVLGKREGAVKMRVHRLLTRLAAEWEGEHGTANR